MYTVKTLNGTTTGTNPDEGSLDERMVMSRWRRCRSCYKYYDTSGSPIIVFNGFVMYVCPFCKMTELGHNVKNIIEKELLKAEVIKVGEGPEGFKEHEHLDDLNEKEKFGDWY